jgi:hypothetical protein
MPEIIVPIKKNYIEEMKQEALSDNAVKDFTQARTNIVNIIEIGSTAISSLGELAEKSQNPEFYAVLSKLMKELGDSSEKLLRVHQQLETITNKKENKTGGNNSSGNVYLTTSEIAKALENLENK